MNYFDGRKIRNQMIERLRGDVAKLSRPPVLSVLWIGDDFASARYIEAKQRVAEEIGIHFDLIKYSNNDDIYAILAKIEELNNDDAVKGIMVQIPVPEKFDQNEIISAISPEKDVDGLRFCMEMSCNFRPPVTLSILEAIKLSGVKVEDSKVAMIGKGFLVGTPIAKILEKTAKELRIADQNTPYLGTITLDADVVVSATGKANIIKPEMIKNGVVLIDAGTAEVGGKLSGDISKECYEKASYYTPVPGGIGPVTVALLMANVVKAAGAKQKIQ